MPDCNEKTNVIRYMVRPSGQKKEKLQY